LIAVAAGDALPAGTDAVVPLELAEPDERAYIEIVEAVPVGQNVEQQGAIATIGATLVPAGTQLAARHIGLLAIAGLFRVPVVRRPRVRMLLAKPVKAGAWEDSNGPMIRAAVERDGGVLGECVEVERDLMAIRAALVEAGVDIVLVIGGTGPGIDDHSAAALAERVNSRSMVWRCVRGKPPVSAAPSAGCRLCCCRAHRRPVCGATSCSPDGQFGVSAGVVLIFLTDRAR
jgi:molybdopterin biosynthesis enzyme